MTETENPPPLPIVNAHAIDHARQTFGERSRMADANQRGMDQQWLKIRWQAKRTLELEKARAVAVKRAARVAIPVGLAVGFASMLASFLS